MDEVTQPLTELKDAWAAIGNSDQADRWIAGDIFMSSLALLEQMSNYSNGWWMRRAPTTGIA